MNLSQSYPDLSAHIAQGLEQLGNIPEELLQTIEQSAQLIANQLLSGGKILVAADTQNQGVAQAFHFDLFERYKQQQPGLPALLLPTCANDRIDSFIRSAEILGQENDILLLVNSSELEVENNQLEQLHLNRGINSIYLGQNLSGLIDAGFTLSLPLASENKYRQLEMNLFILHCLSVRIQSIVFQGH